MSTGYIYKHTSPSGMSYIGVSTKTLGARWAEHVNNAYNENRIEYNYPLQRAIRKYGEDVFTTEVLEDNVPIELLYGLEVIYIDKYDTFYNGYNQTKGGEGTSGTRSLEARENIAKANKERIWTDEMKEKMSLSKSGTNGSKFVPWFIEFPDGTIDNVYDKDKGAYAMSKGWHVGSFKNLFSKKLGVGNYIQKGVFKGFRVGNIGVEKKFNGSSECYKCKYIEEINI